MVWDCVHAWRCILLLLCENCQNQMTASRGICRTPYANTPQVMHVYTDTGENDAQQQRAYSMAVYATTMCLTYNLLRVDGATPFAQDTSESCAACPIPNILCPLLKHYDAHCVEQPLYLLFVWPFRNTTVFYSTPIFLTQGHLPFV